MMNERNSPMTADEAYYAIIEAGLYTFHADNPRHVVRSQIRRHSEGVVFPSSSPTKHFILVGESRYELLNKEWLPHTLEIKSFFLGKGSVRDPHASTLSELQALHEKYIVELKQKILSDLKKCHLLGLSCLQKGSWMYMGFMILL